LGYLESQYKKHFFDCQFLFGNLSIFGVMILIEVIHIFRVIIMFARFIEQKIMSET